MNDYVTENHPALKEFDIEGQEAEEAAAAEAPPEQPVEEQTTEETPVEQEQPVEEAPPSEDPPPEPPPTEDAKPDDITDIVGPDGKYMTYREAAKATRNLQSMYDKKFAEQQQAMQQYQQQVEQWNQYYAQQQQAAEKAAQIDNISAEQWAQQIDLAPVDTLQWAAQEYPEAVPHIISRVRQTKGDAIADQMLVSYQQDQLAMQQYQQQQALAQQQYAIATDPRNTIQLAMDAVTEKYGEEFSGMETEVSEAIQSGNYNIDFGDPANIAGAVEHAFLVATRNRAIQKNQANASAPQAASPQAETGSPGQAPAVTAEDEIADQIVSAWEDNPYDR